MHTLKARDKAGSIPQMIDCHAKQFNGGSMAVDANCLVPLDRIVLTSLLKVQGDRIGTRKPRLIVSYLGKKS
jgi:hypothetical protein